MTFGAIGLAAWITATTAVPSPAPPQTASRDQAAVIVEGIVREIFVSPRTSRVDILVVIDVRAATLGPGWKAGARADVPAPNELAYVHASMTERGRDSSARALPPERAQVRVYLVPGSAGGWEAAAPDGFEPISRDLVARQPGDPDPPADDPPAPAIARHPRPTDQPTTSEDKPRILGVVADPVSIGNRVALKVNEVMPGSPAQAAGIEAGDVILDANGAATTTPEQLAAALRRSGNLLKLTIRNVRTGENVPVNVNLGPADR